MTGKPIAPAGMDCPMWRKPCSKVCHRCELYEGVIGANPQTGETSVKWGCSLKLLVTLTLENSQQQRQTGAAVESLRNVVAAANNATILADARRMEALSGPREQRYIEGGR